jgi:capsular polysaccharide export protein
MENDDAPTVLLLQGPRSPFLRCLAGALEIGGARVERVLFCPGDALFWGRRPAVSWRGRPEAWPKAVAALMRERRVTDVLGLGDGRYWHRTAFAAARTQGVRVHVLEQGWLRPGWLTLEPDRLGGWRPGARDLAASQGAGIPAPSPHRGAGFSAFAAMDVAHHAANFAAGWLTHPHYRPHELHNPVAAWLGWAKRGALWPARRAALARAQAATAAASGPLFLLALQLETDFQIRDHGPPGGLRAALDTVMASFAAHAPAGARLIVKPHPLDPGLTPWQRLVRAGPLGERAIWLDGGDLAALWPGLAGLVTVNSTAGLSALAAGVPVAVLGAAIYGDLAHRGPLEAFWTNPARPDPSAVATFCTALVRTTQLPGTFDGPGMVPGAQAVAARLLARAGARQAA